jgi:rhodanese-related sulfurtransferase
MKKITEKDVKKLKKENPKVLVINVLSEDAYEREHLPDSINIPVENENFLELVRKKVKKTDTPIIVHCSSFECTASTHAATLLEENGYTNVLDFKGGMEEWRSAGNQVTVGV